MVGRSRSVHETVRVAGEAVPGPVGRAGVGSGGCGEPSLVHGGWRQGLGSVYGASPVCGESVWR